MLIKCHECGREISDSATACPGCGAPVKRAAAPAPPSYRAPRAKGSSALGCLILIVVIVVIAKLSAEVTKGEAPAPAASTTPSAEAAARSSRAAMGAVAIKSLKAALRDPDSLAVDRVLVTDNAKYACVEYRAKNGFGGMNRDHVVFSDAGGDQSARGWNRHCVGASGFHDVTSEATMLGE